MANRGDRERGTHRNNAAEWVLLAAVAPVVVFLRFTKWVTRFLTGREQRLGD
jgi:hypothetical protein